MQIKKIRIDNLASFIDFENEEEFSKENLFFGTNGSGKSTLVSLLQYMQSFKENAAKENELKEFLRKRISKESSTQIIEVQISFNTSTITLKYELNKDRLNFSNEVWYPIKVFNDEYTSKNIGEIINIDFSDNGLIIGEKNIELDEAKKRRISLERSIDGRCQYLQKVVDSTIQSFKQLTQSTRQDAHTIISVENIRNNICIYKEDGSVVRSRNDLGFAKPDRKINRLPTNLFSFTVGIQELEQTCLEPISNPQLSSEAVSLLKNYSEFYNTGISIFNEEKAGTCPFCRREWLNAEKLINQYREYLESNYNQKRKEILQAKDKIVKYRETVLSHKKLFTDNGKIAVLELDKYQIKGKVWQEFVYAEDLHKEILALLDDKYENMEKVISIEEPLKRLLKTHQSILESNNEIIDEIDKGIESITSKRRNLNLKVAQHLMKKIWHEHTKDRQELNQFEKELSELNSKIQQLEEATKSQDTVQAVFNGLIDFMGLGEYFLDQNKHLYLKLDKSYDISNEGRRISTAQRKLLSLCYFFADVVSEVADVKELKNYTLIFDDPVDSADYIFFHSIAAVIERNEVLLQSILKQENLKFGQFFVLTHNSLLYDRLSCNWKNYKKKIVKVDNLTKIQNCGNKINNYNIYLDEIITYYKNPQSDTRRMTYVGNLIRRVLEIIASFDNLGSNDFIGILDGMGKSKLAILANHLSHDSFSMVLNPLPDSNELQDACKELFEVIKERHPYQFKNISKIYEIELN